MPCWIGRFEPQLQVLNFSVVVSAFCYRQARQIHHHCGSKTYRIRLPKTLIAKIFLDHGIWIFRTVSQKTIMIPISVVIFVME